MMSQPSESEPEEPPLWAEFSDTPPSPTLPVAPLAEMQTAPAILAESPPRPTIPVDRDRWFVEPRNGRRMGPFTWPELLGCVKAKMFFADDLAYGEVNSHQLYLRDLFPALAVREPTPAFEPLPTALQQLAHNPVITMVLGPEVGPYEKLDPAGVYYAGNLRLIAGLGAVFLVCWAGGWMAVMFGFAAADRTAPIAMNIGAAVAFGLGLLQFTAALLEWEFIFNHRKIRWWRSMYGDIAARKYLLTISWIPMSVGLLLILLVVSLAWG